MSPRQTWQTLALYPSSFYGAKRGIEYRYIRLSHLQHFIEPSLVSYKMYPHMQKARKNIKYKEYTVDQSKRLAVILVQIFSQQQRKFGSRHMCGAT